MHDLQFHVSGKMHIVQQNTSLLVHEKTYTSGISPQYNAMGPFLQTSVYFNPNMDKYSHA